MAGISRSVPASTALAGPALQDGIGVLVPYDMALDRELWRWTPPAVSLFFTRTPYAPVAVTIEMAELVSQGDAILAGIRNLQAAAPSVYAYGCTSGSFVSGVAGERALTQTMRAAGAARSVTASGALLAALDRLAVTRVAIATPYDPQITERLVRFCNEAGVAVVGVAYLGLTAGIDKVPYARTAKLVHQADHPDAQAVVISCTNLPTYDVIAPLEEELGKPVISANQATMWAALGAIDRRLVGPGQRLATIGGPE